MAVVPPKIPPQMLGLVRAHHQRNLLRFADVINLGGKIQSPADFPEQMAAINRCYVEHIKSGKPPAPDPWADKEFWACMESQGFQFCGNCQIFRYPGGACRNDKKNGPDRPTCWRPNKGKHDKEKEIERDLFSSSAVERSNARRALGLGNPLFEDLTNPNLRSEDVTFPTDAATFLDLFAEAHRENLSEDDDATKNAADQDADVLEGRGTKEWQACRAHAGEVRR